jgi:hypothetical protein
MIEEQELGPATGQVQQMMGDEYTSLEVAAALLKLLSGDGGKSDR